jgi:hypothetical protein
MAAMTEDQARTRFMVLNAVRLGGLALVLIALAIHFRKIPVPAELAYVLAALGLAEFFVLPGLLARRWRSADR